MPPVRICGGGHEQACSLLRLGQALAVHLEDRWTYTAVPGPLWGVDVLADEPEPFREASQA